MDSPVIAPPLAGQVLGSHNNSFVIAEWQDAGAPPGASAMDCTEACAPQRRRGLVCVGRYAKRAGGRQGS